METAYRAFLPGDLEIMNDRLIQEAHVAKTEEMSN
jgi:hypothetical protein